MLLLFPIRHNDPNRLVQRSRTGTRPGSPLEPMSPTGRQTHLRSPPEAEPGFLYCRHPDINLKGHAASATSASLSSIIRIFAAALFCHRKMAPKSKEKHRVVRKQNVFSGGFEAFLVDGMGLEPTTPALRTPCSPN